MIILLSPAKRLDYSDTALKKAHRASVFGSFRADREKNEATFCRKIVETHEYQQRPGNA